MTTTQQLWLPDKYKQEFRKATPPPLGEAFGDWSGNSNAMTQYLQLPGGGMLMFDLSRLTLQDFRQMRDHYQVGISLWILTFMMHQLDYQIVCDDPKIQEHCAKNMSEIWTVLVRSMCQAFWSGYAPNVLQWENENEGVILTKIKDLVPERCSVNWKEVEGWAPPGSPAPKIQLYDGIKQTGTTHPIPSEASLWYPLLMENGDYYGRKLLRPAFPAWFFSQLMHLFSNRYFERFGEPLPVGRYPDNYETTDKNNTKVTGRQIMENVVSGIRNRAVAVLPSTRDDNVSAASRGYEWDIEYLESQMRGADFERYLTRLDEEISLALFTPVLLYRTADVGSYNLGDAHYRLFMSMLNSLAADIKRYIDKYVLGRMVDLNFSPNAARAKWVPRRLGKDTPETLRAILQGLIQADLATVDLDELSVALGIGVHERDLLNPKDPMGAAAVAAKEAMDAKAAASGSASPGGTAGNTPSDETQTGGTTRSSRSGQNVGSQRGRALSAVAGMSERARSQILKFEKDNNALPSTLDLGHRRQLAEALGAEEASKRIRSFEGWWSEFSQSDDIRGEDAAEVVKRVLESVAVD